jgi:phage terminase Nu1 subunit (DNA packaging protein)
VKLPDFGLCNENGMAKPRKARQKNQEEPEVLKGWRTIADFLGQPVSVVERWAKSGMPITRQGRSVVASTEALKQWLQRESGEPVHLATTETDLSSELKRSVSQIRH